MAYTVFARKYRPQTFADLVGQEHITKTLSNAITSDRVAHAFLFTGVRGVGKTTSARVLAKALNCEKGPTPEPCNRCDICKEITSGVDLDVLEIDGASNNSVDDVRRLQETIPFRPTRDRYRIVIVDEVHMLSTGAFNAFLKTLEEPPPHVKFIFATTESHKVPVTIRSRCQRYDFRLIPQSVVAARVRKILKEESLEADDQAVAIVAREAAGSMRDALTLLDQIVAQSTGPIRGEDVLAGLGIADRTVVIDLAFALLDGNAKALLELIDALCSQGLDVLHCARQLTEFLRDLVVLRVAGEDHALVELAREERDAAKMRSQTFDLLELERSFLGVSKLVDELARSESKRIAFEMGLVRLATRPRLRDLSEIAERLSALEASARGDRRTGGGPPASGSAPGGRASERSGPTAEPTRQGAEPTRQSAEPTRQSAKPANSEVLPPSEAPVPNTPAITANTPAAVSEPPLSGSPWERIVHVLRERRPALAAIVEHGAPVEVAPERVVLAFPAGSFFGRQAQAVDALESLAAAAEAVFGARPKTEVKFVQETAALAPTLSQVESQRLEERKELLRRKALSHPRVVDAMRVFPDSAGSVDVRVEID